MYRYNRCRVFLSLLTSSSIMLACASGETSTSRAEEATSTSSSTSTGGSGSGEGSGEGPGGPEPTGGEQPPDCVPLAVQVEAILETNCAGCHGPGSTGQGGMDYITSLTALIAKKKVIPGDPEGSSLFTRMNTQQMPPAGVQPRPTTDQIEVVRQWIDAGACVTAGPTSCADNPLITRDQMVETMRDDLEDFESDDQSFIRYVTLTHLYNAGACDSEIEPYRQAISKFFNSLSREALIRVPAAIDPEATIFRIDLRHYGWDATSDVPGADLWDATAAANPHALVFQGTPIDGLRDDTGADIPFQPADSLLHIATRAPLYNKLLGLPATVLELEQSLGVNVEGNVAEFEALRAGFNDSGVSEFNRIIERHAIPTASNRYYYLSHDFNSKSGNANIFAEPIDFVEAGGEYIFSLPNGMQAYAISDAVGNILDEAPIQIVNDPKQRDRTVRTAISCMSCHDRGILPKADEIWPFVKLNLNQFNEDEREKIEALYRPEFLDIQHSDAGIFADALTKAEVSVDAPEPIILTYLSFDADLDLRRAAAELGIDPEILKKNLALLGGLDKSLLALYDGGTISRETFSLVFKDIMCALVIGDKVTPLCANPG